MFFKILLLCFIITSNVSAQSGIGIVLSVIGNAMAEKNQESRILARRSKIYEGDKIITTNKTKVQIKFIDSALLTIQSNSEFLIEEYKYEKSNSKIGVSKLRLLKGGFKTLTGKIAEKFPSNYKVQSDLASMGVRGTYWGAVYSSNNSKSPLNVSVWQDNRVTGINSGVWLENSNYSYEIGPGKAFNHAEISNIESPIVGKLEQSSAFEKSPNLNDTPNYKRNKKSHKSDLFERENDKNSNSKDRKDNKPKTKRANAQLGNNNIQRANKKYSTELGVSKRENLDKSSLGFNNDANHTQRSHTKSQDHHVAKINHLRLPINVMFFDDINKFSNEKLSIFRINEAQEFNFHGIVATNDRKFNIFEGFANRRINSKPMFSLGSNVLETSQGIRRGPHTGGSDLFYDSLTLAFSETEYGIWNSDAYPAELYTSPNDPLAFTPLSGAQTWLTTIKMDEAKYYALTGSVTFDNVIFEHVITGPTGPEVVSGLSSMSMLINFNASGSEATISAFNFTATDNNTVVWSATGLSPTVNKGLVELDDFAGTLSGGDTGIFTGNLKASFVGSGDDTSQGNNAMVGIIDAEKTGNPTVNMQTVFGVTST